MENELIVELGVDGSIEVESGREFTRLIGGFGEDRPTITTRQISELMSLELRVVNQTITRNISDFKEGLDIVDLKNSITQSDSVLSTLKSLGYSNQAISNSKNIYALSQSGFLLYLKFAEGDNAIKLYKNFIEDYFKTKAENVVMKNTIEEQIQNTKEQRAYFMGMAMMEDSESKRMELMGKAEELNRQMSKMEKSITEKEVKRQVVEGLQPQLHIADIISSAKGCYDIGVFAKVLNIEGLGRNKMFNWLREQGILMKTNVPYQRYAKYFKVIPNVNRNGYKNDKSLIRPVGVEYLVKRLMDDGKVVASPVEDILKQLEGIK